MIRRRSIVLTFLVLFGIILAQPASLSPATAQEATDPPPDLLTMLLRADDYLDAGLPDPILAYSGACFPAETYAMGPASYLGVDLEIVIETLDAAGMLTACGSSYVVPVADDQSGTPSLLISSYAQLYTDEDGAEAGFAFLEEESSVPRATDLPDEVGVGDEAEATLTTGSDAFGAFESLDVAFRSGNLTAGVTIYDYTGETPDLDMAVELLKELEDRMENMLDGEGPTLGTMVVRMVGDNLPPANMHSYDVLDGESNRFYWETEADYQNRVEDNGRAENILYAGQTIPGTVSGMGDIYFDIYLTEFGTAREAAEFVEGTPERYMGKPETIEVTVRDDASQYGDTSVALVQEADWYGTREMRDRIAVSVGPIVITASFIGADIPAGVVEDVIEAQVACVENGGCDSTVPIPAALGGPETPDMAMPSTIADAVEGYQAQMATGSAPTAADGTSYTSQLYPFSLTYGDEWTLERPEVNGSREIFTMQNGTSVIVIILDTAHNGHLEDCRDDAMLSLVQSDGVTNALVMQDENDEPVAAVEPDIAWVTMTYTAADGTDAAFHAQCQSVNLRMATIQVLHFMPIDQVERESEAREQLLAGIETGD